MSGVWFAKGLLAFFLSFTVAALAQGQTKSADLPMPQRFDCTQRVTLFPEYSDRLALATDLFGGGSSAQPFCNSEGTPETQWVYLLMPYGPWNQPAFPDLGQRKISAFEGALRQIIALAW